MNLKELLTSLNKDINEYTTILFCDGSGTTSDKPCGFAGKLLLTQSIKDEVLIFGGLSHGTNNLAEMMSTFQALYWLKSNKFESVKLLVISDSEWFVKSGLNIYDIDWRGPNALVWSAIKLARTEWKWEIDFVHIPRNSTEYHEWSHNKANFIRKLII